MSIYHMMHGIKPSTFFILPMLGKHPDEYPRFRDCFTADEEHPQFDDFIHIYTRVGGGNREDYQDEIDKMRAMPGYITDFDDSFDCTYATFVFAIPEQFVEDYPKIFSGRIQETSPEYQAILRKVYPKLESKFDEIFTAC